MNFSSFKLHTQIMAGVETAGYQTPTPIQQQAIPPVLEGKDVMGLAQTGTGKTAAFVLPILERLLPGPRKMVRALIIAPTRELAEQINDNIIILGAKTNIRSATVYGGVGLAPQVQKLKAGTEIIVACPGRLLDHLIQKNADLNNPAGWTDAQTGISGTGGLLNVNDTSTAERIYYRSCFSTLKAWRGSLANCRRTRPKRTCRRACAETF